MECNRFTKLKTIFALGLGGTLFAGYLTFFKALTGSCALGESCPYVFGQPACVYGFVMFLSMTFIAGYAFIRRVSDSWPERVIQIVAVAGALFAGWLTYQDVGPWLQSGGSYTLYLPSCVYGLAFYLMILVLSSVLVNQAKQGGTSEKTETPAAPAADSTEKQESSEEQPVSPQTELPDMLKSEPTEGTESSEGHEEKDK